MTFYLFRYSAFRILKVRVFALERFSNSSSIHAIAFQRICMNAFPSAISFSFLMGTLLQFLLLSLCPEGIYKAALYARKKVVQIFLLLYMVN